MVGTSSSHPEWGAGFSHRAVGPRSVRRARRPHQAGSGRGPGAHPPKWARSDSAQWACAPKQAQSWCRPQEALGRCRYRGPQHRTADSDWGPPTLHSSTGRPAGPACTFRPESRISRTSCVSLLYTLATVTARYIIAGTLIAAARLHTCADGRARPPSNLSEVDIVCWFCFTCCPACFLSCDPGLSLRLSIYSRPCVHSLCLFFSWKHRDVDHSNSFHDPLPEFKPSIRYSSAKRSKIRLLRPSHSILQHHGCPHSLRGIFQFVFVLSDRRSCDLLCRRSSDAYCADCAYSSLLRDISPSATSNYICAKTLGFLDAPGSCCPCCCSKLLASIAPTRPQSKTLRTFSPVNFSTAVGQVFHAKHLHSARLPGSDFILLGQTKQLGTEVH